MSRISSTWYDMFPKYHENAKLSIDKIKARPNKEIFAPSKENEEDDILEVKKISETEFEYSGEIKLKDILKRLQYLAHYNEADTETKPKCTVHMNILGKKTTFKLEESKVSVTKRGWQILVYDEADNKPTFNTIMMSLHKIDQCKLARTILHALNTPLNSQTEFELNEYSDPVVNNVRMFILLTHIAEAAVPSYTTLNEYDEYIKRNKNASPDQRYSSLTNKHGRTPMMDKIVRAKLRKCTYIPIFTHEFSKEAFPSQSTGGTQASRERALNGKEIDHLSDFEDELPQLMKGLRMNQDS